MRGSQRFKEMRRVEKAVAPLQKKGWHVEDLTYEDKEGEPFRVYLTARLDNGDPKDRTL